MFWKEAWDNSWVSDTMWRARLWIPYCLDADRPRAPDAAIRRSTSACLVTGRVPPFGMPANAEARTIVGTAGA